MIKPNFLIIGSPKCGTTSLYNYLQQHPDIEFSDIKEPKYFSFRDLNLNANANEIVLTQLKNSTIKNEEDYLSLFKDKRAKYIGEASPNYFHYEPTAKNIYDFNPEMKMILILRNPSERLYSDWKHNVRMGYDNEYNFRKALKLIEKRKQENHPPYFNYLEKGNYAHHLKRFYQLFKKNQIKIVFYEDLKQDANKLCNTLIKFLGIKEEFQFKTDKIYMKSKPITKNKVLSRFAFLSKKISYRIHKFLVKKSEIPETISRFERKFVTNYYINDIKDLEILINKDLSFWYK